MKTEKKIKTTWNYTNTELKLNCSPWNTDCTMRCVGPHNRFVNTYLGVFHIESELNLIVDCKYLVNVHRIHYVLPDYDWSFQFSVLCFELIEISVKAMEAEQIDKINNEHFATQFGCSKSLKLSSPKHTKYLVFILILCPEMLSIFSSGFSISNYCYESIIVYTTHLR